MLFGIWCLDDGTATDIFSALQIWARYCYFCRRRFVSAVGSRSLFQPSDDYFLTRV